jgi:L-asparaginase
MLRTDGKENILTAIEIAAAKQNNKAIVPEVCIYFNSLLFRGNRSSKIDSAQFRAFDSKNYPALAKAGVEIVYSYQNIAPYPQNRKLKVHQTLNTNVFILKIFPGISAGIIESFIDTPGVRGIVLESFGSGNVPDFNWFSDLMQKAIQKGIVVINISQCSGGKVQMGLYQTSKNLQKAGVISGYDMTTEAAITKLMYVLSFDLSQKETEKMIMSNIRGEITI